MDFSCSTWKTGVKNKVCPSSQHTHWPRPTRVLCSAVSPIQIHPTSGRRPCSNNSTHSSNFKGLCQEAWWIPEAQGMLLKACPLKCYKSPGGTDILPDSLIKAETPSQFLLLHLKNGTTSPPHSRIWVFQWDSSFQQVPTRKNCRKKGYCWFMHLRFM